MKKLLQKVLSIILALMMIVPMFVLPSFAEEASEEEEVTELQNAIIADGFMVRMKEYTGLRALFTFKSYIDRRNENNGYTLVSYGAILSSYATFENTYGSDEDALFAAARAGGDEKVKLREVYNEIPGDGGLRVYTDIEKKQFCISITDIGPENALSDIYVAGYAIYMDAENNEVYTLTTYNMADGAKAVNLYEITLGLTKSGLMNSEFADDVCFWQILKNGALKVADTSGADYGDNADKLVDGEFTYLDVNWHALNGSSGSWSGTWSGVNEEESGLVWSVLKYTDDEYVLVYRNKDKEDLYTKGVSIPSYGKPGSEYVAPWYHTYGSSSFTKYNPALSQDDYMKIQTLVIDHGVKGTSSKDAGMAGFKSIKVDNVNYGLHTIVYPDVEGGFTAYEFTFAESSMLRNVIWCHADENGEPVQHMSEFPVLQEEYSSLIDLRGFTKLGFRDTFENVWGAKNIVFNANMTAVARKPAEIGWAYFTFNGASGVQRVWFAGDEMPEAGTMDLSKLPVTKIGERAFNLGSSTIINTVKLPDALTTVTGQGTKYTFGNKLSINYVCSEAVQNAIVNFLKTNKSDSSLQNSIANITVNGTPTADLIG